MNIIQQITRDNLYWQARRICYEKELPPEYLENVLAELVQREFMRQTEPFLKIKGSAVAMCVHFSIYPTGVVRRYSPEQQEVMDSCDQHIAEIARHLGEAMGMDLNIRVAA